MKQRKIELFTGVTLEQWQADVQNIRWAQTTPEFRAMLSVLLHEMERVPEKAAAAMCSEGRAFGRLEGFRDAIETLRNMGRSLPKATPDIEATHDERPENAFKLEDVRD